MPTISIKIPLLKPTKQKQHMYERMTRLNTDFSNWLVHYEGLSKATSKVYSEYTDEKLPSAVVNQTIRDVKSKVKNQQAKLFHRLWCEYNNQNCRFQQENGLYKVSFPTQEKRIGVPLDVRDFHRPWLDKLIKGEVKQGTTKLHEKKGRWFVTVSFSYEVEGVKVPSEKVMGVDLGLNYLAVATIGTHATFYSGKQVAYVRRRYRAKRKKLGNLKKMNAIRTLNQKESRWMKNYNHQLSRQLINLAIRHGVTTIRMEDLTGIRMRRSPKEAGRTLHSWAFYQLQTMIHYKAEMAGIVVEYVNPTYTSQTCKCGHCDKQNRNRHVFRCLSCGYQTHSDVNAGINISKAISGLSSNKSVA